VEEERRRSSAAEDDAGGRGVLDRFCRGVDADGARPAQRDRGRPLQNGRAPCRAWETSTQASGAGQAGAFSWTRYERQGWAGFFLLYLILVHIILAFFSYITVLVVDCSLLIAHQY
jgi:hypothetical protein